MSFIKLGSQNLENVSLLLRPAVHFLSSSIGGGVTGSQYVSPVRSPAIKQVIDYETAFDNLTSADPYVSNQRQLNEDNYKRATSLELAKTVAKNGLTNIDSLVGSYLNLINDAPNDVRFDKKIDAYRFDPPFVFSKDTTVKNITRKILMPFHQHKYDDCGFWYSNYNTLNFFSNNNIPTGSALLYGNANGEYDLPESFSLSFWINPRYSNKLTDYRAGTIFHLSSSICVSIVSGSSIDEFGDKDEFKILLQLSQSADKAPSTINLNSPSSAYPNDLIFTSSYTLKKNNWHNVFITWSNTSNNAYGSIFIDDKKTEFNIPSASLGANSNLSPLFVCLGNYYDNNYGSMGGLITNQPEDSLGNKIIEGYYPASTSPDRAFSFGASEFSHPLNAEIHDIRLYNKSINKQINKYKDIALTSPTSTQDLIFYVPVYFYPSSSVRDSLVSPYENRSTSTSHPFNVDYSYTVGGKMTNLENFALDFVNMRQPRLLGLFPQIINTIATDVNADTFTYNTGSNVKRLLSILPNDNGLHTPKYDLIQNSVMSESNSFKKSGRYLDHSIISLENMVSTSSIIPGISFTAGPFLGRLLGASPTSVSSSVGSLYSIVQTTRDVSSNEISILDISNLYYGSKIHPATFELYDENITGSNGDIKIKIKDNGRGGLYRADCETKQAVWNNVGNVLYEEGMVIIKSPNLPYFCKDKVDMKFRGEQQLNTMILNIPVEIGQFMSSSNKTFKSYPPDSYPHNKNLSTVHITNINIHDDNFNVIMKAQVSQPITKTEEDEFVIRLKQDF